ncbi:MAG: SGNH/GDSL hydrolase family protein [Phaeodactylibacter sp.]|nr:SGNH/GDSL hydrolase family protein [Phaeodactylibacter sp.]MCB9273452.1 SGNH/GDSL hydrolase family protein [Lewinellaceae bacterium]
MASDLHGAKRLNILFIGNSYTHTHDMPAILQKLAQAGGAQLAFEMRAPGGWSLEQHYRDKETLRAIKKGGWTHIVLQDQSQRAAMPIMRVRRQFFRYVRRFNRYIWWQLAPKPAIVLYLTWGRKDGDADNRDYYPPVGTFEGMTALLAERYHTIARKIGAEAAPVGPAWAYVRRHHPEIELYQEDGHHPSPAGSYLAACCFYRTLFGASPQALDYDFTLHPAVAAKLRAAAGLAAVTF